MRLLNFARVDAQLAGMKGIRTYGIEFLEENHRVKNFWGITFPSNASCSGSTACIPVPSR